MNSKKIFKIQYLLQVAAYICVAHEQCVLESEMLEKYVFRFSAKEWFKYIQAFSYFLVHRGFPLSNSNKSVLTLLTTFVEFSADLSRKFNKYGKTKSYCLGKEYPQLSFNVWESRFSITFKKG